MKTVRYIVAIAVIILGGLLGYMRGTNMMPPGNIINSFLGIILGGIGLFIGVLLALKIWPDVVDKKVYRYVYSVAVFLVVPFLGLSGGLFGINFGLNTTDFPLFEALIGLLCGGSLGLIIAIFSAWAILRPIRKNQ
jgi:hypothetical protein